MFNNKNFYPTPEKIIDKMTNTLDFSMISTILEPSAGFDVTFYKKGTTHITFKNEELLKKFNIYGAQKKGWLPPNYGKSKYSDMTQDEKAVVKDFDGCEANYNKILDNNNYYLVSRKNLLEMKS